MKDSGRSVIFSELWEERMRNKSPCYFVMISNVAANLASHPDCEHEEASDVSETFRGSRQNSGTTAVACCLAEISLVKRC